MRRSPQGKERKMGATSHLLITQFSHLIKSTALNGFSPLSQTSACSSRTSSTWGGEVPVSPRVSVASPALHHCCLPEHCQPAAPARGAAIPLPAQSPCCRRCEARVAPSSNLLLHPHHSSGPGAALWLERLLATREAPLCSGPVS